MASITETKNRLPQDFVNNLYEMFTPGVVDNTQIDIKDALPAFNDGLEKSINQAIRILPSKQMEGFFVAKFIKLK